MRIGTAAVISGALVLASGVIFFLQGNSVVGPTSSFMYSSPEWVAYGEYIAIVGALMVLTGLVFSLRRPRS